MSRAAKVWNLLREALAGETQDLTALPVGRAVLLLAVPMVMEMSMESLFAVVDIFWVSKVGSNAVAVVGLTESLLSMMYAMAMGLAMGGTAVVSRRTGEGDPEGAASAALHVLLVACVASLLVGIAGVAFGRQLLALMGADAEVVALGSGYVRWMFGGKVTIMLLFVINAIFRGAGDATLAMRSLWSTLRSRHCASWRRVSCASPTAWCCRRRSTARAIRSHPRC